MSQPFPQQAQQQPPSSWNQAQSFDGTMPPAKRQRLSPGPASPAGPLAGSPYANSPYATSTPPNPYQNISLPNNYNRPPPQQVNGAAYAAHTAMPPPSTMPPPRSIYTQPGFSQGQPQMSGAMGPPQRPVERPQQQEEKKERGGFDPEALNDSVRASGVDLKAEEALLASSWRNNVSNSFDMLSRGALGDRAADLEQQRIQMEKDREYRRHKQAARKENEQKQHHLEDPFLFGNCIRRRMERVAQENAVQVPLDGLFDRVQNAGPPGSAQVQAPSVLNRNAPLEPMLSLLSLATNERIRGMLEDAYGLARGRQLGADGVVPPDWSDLAVGQGAQSMTTQAKSITDTAWDQAKQADPTSQLPSPPLTEAGSPAPVLQPTIAVKRSNSINAVLAIQSRQDRAAEEARLKLRNARKAKKAAQPLTSESAPGTPIDGAAPDAMATGLLGEKAPEVKMSKKARDALEKSARAENSEEKQTVTANQTASMALGSKAKKYAWMTKGAAPAPARTVPGKTGPAATTVATVKKSSGVAENFAGVKDIKYGQWREDGIGGRGIQLRDWIGVLEMDGREKRTLGWAYARQGLEVPDGVTTTIMSEEAANALPNNMHTDVPSTAQAYAQQPHVHGYTNLPQTNTPVSATSNYPWGGQTPQVNPHGGHQQGNVHTGTVRGGQYIPPPHPGSTPQQSQTQNQYQTSSQSQPQGQYQTSSQSQPSGSGQSFPSQSAPSSLSQGLSQQSQQVSQQYQAKPALSTPSQIPPQSSTPAPTQNGVAVS